MNRGFIHLYFIALCLAKYCMAGNSAKFASVGDNDDPELMPFGWGNTASLPKESGSNLDEGGGSNVLPKQMAIKIEGREDAKLDLTGDLSKLKDNPILMKEGTEYRIELTFRVQREIVPGLRYFQQMYRKGIRVGKFSYMVGSYGPGVEPHVYLGPLEEAPKGMIARGHYVVKSKFIDDDKNTILAWEWSFDIKKNWE